MQELWEGQCSACRRWIRSIEKWIAASCNGQDCFCQILCPECAKALDEMAAEVTPANGRHAK